MNGSKKLGEMTKEERKLFGEDTLKITEEEAAEYGICGIENPEGYCDDPEMMKNTMGCLGDKFLAGYAILKAMMQTKGGREEYEAADDDDADGSASAAESMSIFEYEDRYGEKT